jgi:hypothetical protein
MSVKTTGRQQSASGEIGKVNIASSRGSWAEVQGSPCLLRRSCGGRFVKTAGRIEKNCATFFAIKYEATVKEPPHEPYRNRTR